MTGSDYLLLEILRHALIGQKYTGPETDDRKTAGEIIGRAREQKVLPLIFDTAEDSGLFRSLDRRELKELKREALQEVTRQLTQTTEFLVLLEKLQGEGLDPILVKGMACRTLYPIPCLRSSVDEDILVPDDSFSEYPERLTRHGMNLDIPYQEADREDEISFHKKDSPLYIEIHKRLFPSDADAFNRFNTFFEKAGDRTDRMQVQGLQVRILEPTDHFLYLILHAFKHFVYSGFGIRMVCDIAVYGHSYHSRINWQYIRDRLESVQAFDFTRAVCRIIDRYIFPDAAFLKDITEWSLEEIDEIPMLEDIMQGGLHGNTSIARLHSGNITVHAVNYDQRGKGTGNSLLHTIFLPAKSLESRYVYLKKAPFLLPFAWGQRIVRFISEAGRGSNKNAVSDSLRLGNDRVQLLRHYHIIGSRAERNKRAGSS